MGECRGRWFENKHSPRRDDEVEEVGMGSKWGGFPYQWRLEYTKNVRELSSLTFLSMTSINLKKS